MSLLDENKEEELLIKNRDNFINEQKDIKYYQNGRNIRIEQVTNNYANNFNKKHYFNHEFNSIVNSYVYVDYNLNKTCDFTEYKFNDALSVTVLDEIALLAAVENKDNKEPIVMKNLLNKFKKRYQMLTYDKLYTFLREVFSAEKDRSDLLVEYDILKDEILVSKSKTGIISYIKRYILNSIVNENTNEKSEFDMNSFLSHFKEDSSIELEFPETLSDNVFNHKVTREKRKYYSMVYDKSFETLINLYMAQFSSLTAEIIIYSTKPVSKLETSILTENITLNVDNRPIEDIRLITTDVNYKDNSNSNVTFDLSKLNSSSNMYNSILLLKECKEHSNFPNNKFIYFINDFITNYIPDLRYAKLFDFALTLFSRNLYNESINLCKFISSKIQLVNISNLQMNNTLTNGYDNPNGYENYNGYNNYNHYNNGYDNYYNSNDYGSSNDYGLYYDQMRTNKPFEPHNDTIRNFQPNFNQKMRLGKMVLIQNFAYVLLVIVLVVVLVFYIISYRNKHNKGGRVINSVSHTLHACPKNKPLMFKKYHTSIFNY